MAMVTVETLAEWVRTREATSKPRQDRNLVAFLAVKPFVNDAIEAGYSLLTIWNHLRERGCIACSYETFGRHVRRHIKNRGNLGQPSAETPTGTAPIGKQAETLAPPKKPEATGFTYNPVPNPAELI